MIKVGYLRFLLTVVRRFMWMVGSLIKVVEGFIIVLLELYLKSEELHAMFMFMLKCKLWVWQLYIYIYIQCSIMWKLRWG